MCARAGLPPSKVRTPTSNAGERNPGRPGFTILLQFISQTSSGPVRQSGPAARERRPRPALESDAEADAEIATFVEDPRIVDRHPVLDADPRSGRRRGRRRPPGRSRCRRRGSRCRCRPEEVAASWTVPGPRCSSASSTLLPRKKTFTSWPQTWKCFSAWRLRLVIEGRRRELVSEGSTFRSLRSGGRVGEPGAERPDHVDDPVCPAGSRERWPRRCGAGPNSSGCSEIGR